jgi:hypothetical protein
MSEGLTHDEFADAVMEEIFIRGFVCPPRDIVVSNVRSEWDWLGAARDPKSYAERTIQIFGLTNGPNVPARGISTPTLGAAQEWIAIHEAGHVIVGLRAGLSFWGVRFYDDGLQGEAGFVDPDWENSADEELLRWLIRVDVAANVAELLHGHEPNGGRPSQFFSKQKPVVGGQYPSDVICAWKRARRLAIVQFEKEGMELDEDRLWAARKLIIEEAEADVEQILRENREALTRLAEQLRRGPLTGAAVRAIVDQ